MVRETLKLRVDTGQGKNDPSFKGIEITEYQYKGSRMGMPELTATLMWPTCLDDEWTRKEYAEFNGERFYIRHTPSSSKSNTDERYKHEISFTSEFAEILGNTYFVDAVPDSDSGIECQTANKPCSNNTSFKLYGTIAEFVDRLNCAFLYAGVGDSALRTRTFLTAEDAVTGDGYCAVLDSYGEGSQYDPEKNYEFVFEDKKLWEAVTEGYNITGIPFERRGRKIIFGAPPTVVLHKFEYGHDNELLSVEKKNANAQVINRITMVGGSENIPYYYPNETEYGHIGIKTMSGNKALTAGMIEIANMTHLLSRLNADTYAVLRKHDDSDDGGAVVAADGYTAAFGSGIFASYQLGSYQRHTADGSLWHVRAFFNVTKAGMAECGDIRGRIWTQGTATPESDASLIAVAKLEALRTVEDKSQGIESLDLSSQMEKKDGKISLGYLPEGSYYFQFSLEIQKRGENVGYATESLCYLSEVSVRGGGAIQHGGYYWEAGGKRYDTTEAIGVRINGAITDSMIGDGFGWEASGRMPFQSSLMPSKYRKSLGSERFYNALNDTYIDPDTGRTYNFPNPYIFGAPSEHIYRNEGIKPTIECIRNAETDPYTGMGQLFGSIADVAYDDGDSDALKAESEEGDKNDALKYEHSFFYIKLNIFNGDYGFDLFAHASQTDAMTIQMTSGSCNGCKFKIQAAKFTDSDGVETYKNPVVVKNGVAVGVVSEDGIKEGDLDPEQQNTQENSIWICVQKDAGTFGVLMPNHSGGFKPQTGDKFNIINIDLPQSYILAAEKRLEEEGIRFMADNNEEKFTFGIQASRIFLAENPEVMEQIDEYSKIKVRYDGKEYEQYVNQLTIDCKDGEPLPNIGIDLTDTLAVGQTFVDNVAERAVTLISNAASMGGSLGSGGGGMSAALAERRYLNKMKNDRTPYALSVGDTLTAESGARFGEFVHGQFTGSGGAVDGGGNGEFESIVVRSSMKVMELIYNRLNAQEADTSFADSGTIDIVFSKEDGTRIAQIRRRWDGDFTSFQPGDIVYGYVNDISRADKKEYYKAWAWIKSVDRANNQIAIVPYSGEDVPSGTNYPLTAGMMITRWGNNVEPTTGTYINPEYRDVVIGKRGENEYYNKRQSSFFISCDDGNIVELMGVNKPILERGNYGTILGRIPDGLLDSVTEEAINKDQPYLFARGIIVQDLIRIGYEGLATRTANYRGTWDPKTAASQKSYYRQTPQMYDTVTYDGALWQCITSKSTEPPSDLSGAWLKMTATPDDGKELRMWAINPSASIVSVRKSEVIPPMLSSTVTLSSSHNPPSVISSNLDLYDEGAQLYFSVDGLEWKEFVIGVTEPLELEDETGVIELEDSVDDSKILTVGGNDINTDTIGDRIYFELREVGSGTVLAATQVPVVKDGKDGKDGVEGRDGLMVYPAGYYDINTAYFSDEDTMPVVMYGDEETGEYNYYRLKPGAVYQGALRPANRDNPAKDAAINDGETAWVLFDKFNSIFADIIMANFAKLGAAVFYGDWMISQNGVDGAGNPTNQYQGFKTGDFEPNFSVNFLTGEIKAFNGLFKGRVEAESGTFNNVSIEKDCTFAGLFVKKTTVVTPSNLEEYMYSETLNTEVIRYMDLNKVGTLIEFREFTTSTLMPPVIELPRDREYVGNTVLVYNYSGRSFMIGGPLAQNETADTQNFEIKVNYMACFTCKVRIIDGKEQVYWEVRRGEINNLSIN